MKLGEWHLVDQYTLSSPKQQTEVIRAFQTSAQVSLTINTPIYEINTNYQTRHTL